MTLSKNVKGKPTSIRFKKWLNDDVESYMKRHNIERKSIGIHSYVQFLKKEIEKLRQALTSKTLKVSPSNKPKSECAFIAPNNKCAKFFLKRGKLIDVNSDFCDYCWELQQKLKTEKSVKPSTSTFYKKPAKIKCKITNRWEDPLKIQAKCERCKKGNIYKWAECQREYIEQTLY